MSFAPGLSRGGEGLRTCSYVDVVAGCYRSESLGITLRTAGGAASPNVHRRKQTISSLTLSLQPPGELPWNCLGYASNYTAAAQTTAAGVSSWVR